MKKYGLSIGTAVLAIGLAACGTDDNNEAPNDTIGEADNAAENITNTDNNSNDNNMNTNEGNNNENNMNTNEETNAEDNDASAWYEDLNFHEFELDVEYADGEYEVEYEYNDGNPEAEIEDSRAGADTEMEGQEALDELEGKLTQLDLTADSSEEEVFSAVIDAFDLEEDYDELEVELEFFDDGELEAEDE
ncbi:YusW family protein [Salipaludibacillus keqinensis]|nr:YusW family protein [Salipaludibacillus keqinensis]